jgi:hypothetical protein
MLAVLMKTREYPELLKRTVDSYLKSSKRPDKLYVFDDQTPEENQKKIIEQVKRIPEAEFKVFPIRRGHASATPHAVGYLLNNPDVDGCLILDSDTIFNRDWYRKALELYDFMLKQKEVAMVSLFNNTHEHKARDCGIDGLAEKDLVGGFGTIMSRNFFTNCLSSISWDVPNSWDWNVAPFINHPWKIYATEKSYLQHIGHEDKPDTMADNFVGE